MIYILFLICKMLINSLYNVGLSQINGISIDIIKQINSAQFKTIALSGPLGAGKTTLASALIRNYLGDFSLNVSSPTFSILKSYGAIGQKFVNHFDLYRIKDYNDFVESGLVDAMASADLNIIEWPEIAMDKFIDIAGPYVGINISYTNNDTGRNINCVIME